MNFVLFVKVNLFVLSFLLLLFLGHETFLLFIGDRVFMYVVDYVLIIIIENNHPHGFDFVYAFSLTFGFSFFSVMYFKCFSVCVFFFSYIFRCDSLFNIQYITIILVSILIFIRWFSFTYSMKWKRVKTKNLMIALIEGKKISEFHQTRSTNILIIFVEFECFFL